MKQIEFEIKEKKLTGEHFVELVLAVAQGDIPWERKLQDTLNTIIEFLL